MATDTAQFIGLSVEEETLISVEPEPAESGVMIALVQQGFGLTVAQGCFYAVEAGRSGVHNSGFNTGVASLLKA